MALVAVIMSLTGWAVSFNLMRQQVDLNVSAIFEIRQNQTEILRALNVHVQDRNLHVTSGRLTEITAQIKELNGKIDRVIERLAKIQ